MSYEVFIDDAVEFLRKHPGKIDCIVTDPAYESLEKHRAKGTTTRLKKSNASSNEWFDIFPNERFADFFEAAYAALKPNTHLYVFCDQETMFHIKPLGEAAGFKFWKPLVWEKQKIGMGYHYRAKYEFILFFEKGKRKLNDLSVPDVLSYPRVDGGYPTEKPWRLKHRLITNSTQVGDLVADPFVGSGSCGHAAIVAGCNFIGCDISAAAANAAAHSLQYARPIARE